MAGGLQEAADIVAERYRTVRRAVNERIDRLSPFQRRLLAALRFLAVFAVLAAPVYGVLHVDWEAPLLREITATVSATVLNVIGLEVVQQGSFIHADSLVLDVTRDSTGWKSLFAFTALVLATQEPVRRKLSGVAAGMVVIGAANVTRIVSMVYAVEVFGVPYELLHTVLWRWGLTGVVLVAWIGWLHGTALRRICWQVFASVRHLLLKR